LSVRDHLLDEFIDRVLQGLLIGRISFPRFTHEVERVVMTLERQGSKQAPVARRLWGQIEVINALRLEDGQAPSSRDISNTQAYVDGLKE
jgi:hypothetical protein